MKKTFPLIFLILLLIGGYFLLQDKKEEKLVEKKTVETAGQKKQGTIEGIKEMVAKNLSVRCDYQIEGGTKVTVYFKGKDKIRSTVDYQNKKAETIILNEKMYSWDTETKEGVVTNISQLKTQKDKSSTAVEDPQKYLDELEKMKVECKQENFSESIFQPPTDIKFQDLNELQEMMKQGDSQTPLSGEEE